MPPTSLVELLKLPAQERAELAFALWDSLSDAQRETELSLTPDQEAELDRRWADHIENPDAAIPWDEIRSRLQGTL
ncbi:MAG: addiction module protein [Gemmatimonadaceae bacterium]|jgi:putative addiction module component (TIGR02574 family)|nr:addiction module protein [Gemmatimonadaceae bacterium]